VLPLEPELLDPEPLPELPEPLSEPELEFPQQLQVHLHVAPVEVVGAWLLEGVVVATVGWATSTAEVEEEEEEDELEPEQVED
jgi:hypothetical protein